MKLNNVASLLVSGALVVLLSGCGAKDCPAELQEQLLLTMLTISAQKEEKQKCLERVAPFKKHDGCKFTETTKDGNFSYKKLEGLCKAN